MSDDPSSPFDMICAEVERQLQGGEVSIAAEAAFDLLLAVRYELDNAPRPSVIAHGVLYQAIEAARAQVYAHLNQLCDARREVLDARQRQWLSGQRDVRALLIDVLNVLLAAIEAAAIEQAYADTERQAMAAAVVAEIGGDALGVELQRVAIDRIAAGAIRRLAHGTMATEAAGAPAPVAAIHAEVVRRMRGEASTELDAAGELMIAVRHLVDRQPGSNLTYGPLLETVRMARESVYECLIRRWNERRVLTRADRDMRDVRALLSDLDSVLLEAATAETIEHAYRRAEQRAMASAIVAEMRGDAMGVDVQRDVVRQAATDALEALREVIIR
ncbi:hypothetical protein PJJ85_29310 [Mycobacterium kansasii]|uniref:hypothetical protein n=1 Tax=Mycobacterium kansasii TaxID=1768 RepID=UPI000A09E527|nr:hypothetical protein [Mycobacterium kansasii]ORB98692.1 hypothetical protein B1T48_28570 [Mycobacterium persicum]